MTDLVLGMSHADKKRKYARQVRHPTMMDNYWLSLSTLSSPLHFIVWQLDAQAMLGNAPKSNNKIKRFNVQRVHVTQPSYCFVAGLLQPGGALSVVSGVNMVTTAFGDGFLCEIMSLSCGYCMGSMGAGCLGISIL